MAEDNLEQLSQEQVDEREAKAMAELARIQKYKSMIRAARHETHVQEVKALIEQYGLQATELFPNLRLAPEPVAVSKESTKRGRKEGTTQGPADIKFQNAKGEVWKGRGLPAAWLLEYQAAGGKLLDIAVPGLVWDGALTRDTNTKEMRPPTWVQMLLDEGVTSEQLKAGLKMPT